MNLKTTSFNNLLFQLICLYALLLPFEFILKVYLGIDTIFKPYRVISLVIFAVFVFRSLRYGLVITQDFKADVFLYAIFFYGIFISLFRIITGPFSMKHFNNDLFQSTLYLTTYFVFKSLELSRTQLIRVFNFFTIGLALNALYVFYNFRILSNVNRDAGFMDNPNYLALGLVAVITYILYKLGNARTITRQLSFLILTLLLLYVFNIAGSRTGLVLLVIAGLLIFYFSALQKKIALVLITVTSALLLFPLLSNKIVLDRPLILVNRVATTINSGEEDIRFAVWRGTFQALEERGYLGMGIGQFKANFSLLFTQITNDEILEMVNRDYHLSTHNDLLALLTDFGLPGTLFYLIFLYLVFIRLIRQRFNYTHSREIPLLLNLNFIVFCCLIIFGLAAENFQNQLFWFLMMFSTKSFSDQELSRVESPNT